MRFILLCGLVAGLFVVVPFAAQEERPVPKDSERVTIRGCARGRAFLVGPRSEDQPGSLEIAPGRRFRINGSKKVLDDIKARERSVIELTGLVRKSDVNPPQGLPILGGRVRIGGAVPQDPIASAQRNSSYSQATIDVEGWRVAAGNCSDKGEVE
jgi:hypothetical protein